MGSNPNTISTRTVWNAVYQISHFKEAVYPVFADETMTPDLLPGITVKRSYAGNIVTNDMGGDGSYSTQAFTDTDESLTINRVKEASVFIKELDLIQTHLPLKMKYARKSMNALFTQIDADVLNSAYSGANTIIDDGTLGGVAGNGINLTAGNVTNVFTAADTFLRLANVKYNYNYKYTGKIKKDATATYAFAIVSPYFNQQLNLALGSKNSALGDQVSIKGYAQMFQGFNVFVSNNITWEGTIVLSTVPTANDTITINGVVFTFVATPAVAGDVVVANTAANGAINLKNALNALNTTITNSSSAGYVPLSAANQTLLTNQAVTGANPNITASVVSSTSVKVVMSGFGNVIVSQSMVASSNVWTAVKQIQHNLFGVSKAISLVIQKNPSLYINPASGKVGKDYATWAAYGFKVFNDQKYQLLDVQVQTSAFLTAPTNTTA